MNNYVEVSSAIFQLNPYRLAVLKENAKTIELFQNSFSSFSAWRYLIVAESRFTKTECLMHAWRTKTHHHAVKIGLTSELEFCVGRRNRKLLKAVLTPYFRYPNIDKAFELTFRYNLKDMQDDLIEYVRAAFNIDRIDDVWRCAVSAIVYNQAEVLHSLMQILKSIQFNGVEGRLSVISKVLNRTICSETLKKNHFEDTDGDSLEELFSLLSRYYNDQYSEIKDLLKAAPKVQEAVNSPDSKGRTRLRVCIGHERPINPVEIKVLLELGADIDYLDSEGNTALSHLLSRRYYSKRLFKRYYTAAFRGTVEILLYENPSMVLNSNAVKLAIDLDEHLEGSTIIRTLVGEFIMDFRTRSPFGSIDDEAFALNFMGPLLMECGFPVTRDLLESALEKSLHAAELAYIRRHLYTARSLKCNCRDVLRKHFKRRQLHQFVRLVDLPKQIESFILLKDILLSL